MKYQNIREEELKNKVGQDFFANFDTTKIVGNIDFCVTHKSKSNNQEQLFDHHSLLWAEAKRGTFDMLTMITQLVLTIGKARTFDKFLPPAFLGAFDSQNIGFVPYNAIMEVFSMNDFNWNVTPSNHETKEFKLIKERIEKSFQKNHYVYNFIKNESELQFFIKNNIAKATESGKILIDKNNFVPIYLRWLDQVKPCINFDWAEGRKQNILDSDFYLADLFVDDKGTTEIDDDTPLNDNLFVVFRNSHYEIAKENLKSLFNASIEFNDKNGYEQFWKRYKRPPLEEIQHHIIDRRDLLVPQDIRERKGAFFTPKKWVELSQQYIADVLGEDWQEEYYVWDCAAGTGNLLAGLTNKFNIWASTLDQADVNVMHDRIENGAILLKDHCFQFDFLNDDFSKLPQGLQNIINDEEKRKKLVIYINPPYAESGNKSIISGQGENKSNVASNTNIYKNHHLKFGTATRELFAQFLIRIIIEIPNSVIAQFSTLKFIQSQNFSKFRLYFKAEYKKGFIVPANTFDNVKGQFPIGFFIWNLNSNKFIETIKSDIFDSQSLIGEKIIHTYDKGFFLIDWLRNYYDKKSNIVGYLRVNGPDVQNNLGVFLTYNPSENDLKKSFIYNITNTNLLHMSIYYTVRQCIEPDWINDRDQYTYPNNNWETDLEFQNDCLTFALFHSQNKISSSGGTNHWIPFTEQEVNAKEKFESNFMTQFIKGKIIQEQTVDLFSSSVVIPAQEEPHNENNKPLEFSEKATNVFNTGRELWRYYHSQNFSSTGGMLEGRGGYNANASLYDIREHFQGRNDKGKMNNKSQDETYMKLITQLRDSLKQLAQKIEPKVYEYGFLKA